MTKNKLPVSIEHVEKNILLIRDQRVILDCDLAKHYGVPTKRLNEQIKRNRKRFPDDFIFQLTAAEKTKVVADCDHLSRLKFSKTLPYAFTEHGAIMVATILNSQRAIEVSIFVVRAFIKLREVLATHKKLAYKIEVLERHLKEHDQQIQAIVEAIRQLMTLPEKPRKKIGFQVKERRAA